MARDASVPVMHEAIDLFKGFDRINDVRPCPHGSVWSSGVPPDFIDVSHEGGSVTIELSMTSTAGKGRREPWLVSVLTNVSNVRDDEDALFTCPVVVKLLTSFSAFLDVMVNSVESRQLLERVEKAKNEMAIEGVVRSNLVRSSILVSSFIDAVVTQR